MSFQGKSRPQFGASSLFPDIPALILRHRNPGGMTLGIQQILIRALDQGFGISPGMMGTRSDKQILLGLSGSFPSVLATSLSQFLCGCCSRTETSRKEKNLFLICNSKGFKKYFFPLHDPRACNFYLHLTTALIYFNPK